VWCDHPCTLRVCETVARGGVCNRTVALRVCEAVARGGVCNRTVALRVCEAVVRCGVTAPVLFACVRPSSGVAVLSWALVAVWRLAVPGLSGAGANEGTGEDLFEVLGKVKVSVLYGSAGPRVRPGPVGRAKRRA